MVTLPESLLSFYEQDSSFDTLIRSWLSSKGITKLQEPLLILAETGVPRETLARLICRKLETPGRPWVSLNCGQPAGVKTLENFLSGVATPEQSAVCFLDYFGNLSPQLQEKVMVQVLEKQVRHEKSIIFGASVNRRNNPSFFGLNENIYHTLETSTLNVPPLRMRGQGILDLASAYARVCFASLGKQFESFSPEAQQCLLSYDWPGNDLELFSVLDRAALLSETGLVLPTDLWIPSAHDLKVVSLVNLPEGMALTSEPMTYTDLKKRTSDQFEKEYLTQALIRNQGNVSAAAREARLDRSNFLRLLRKHGLSAKGFRKAA